MRQLYLVKSDDIYFAATAVTDSDLLKGVVYSKNNWATTQSIVMRSKTGTIRFVEAKHHFSRRNLVL